MEKRNSSYEQFVEAPSHRRLLEQESLILEAGEFLSVLMSKEGVSRAELARRLGRSKAYVTQLLRGSNNLTLRTLADVGTVLGYRFRLGAESFASGRFVSLVDDPNFYETRHDLQACWRGFRPYKQLIRQQQSEEGNEQILPLCA